MHYYKTIVSYEGTAYAGFQWQNNLKTVQNAINETLARLNPGKITTIAASRTDTGVHAFEQIVKISSELAFDQSTFIENFNHSLPCDIRCMSIEESSGLYRPSSAAQSKEYRYFFTNDLRPIKEHSQFVANISNSLDIDKIMTCLNALRGQHDFSNFYSSGSNVKTTIRTILNCELAVVNPHNILGNAELFKIPGSLTSCYQLKIEANGFLKQMVRHIVSALWMVGSNKLTTDEFIDLLNFPKESKQHWKVAPPNGLFLYKINSSNKI